MRSTAVKFVVFLFIICTSLNILSACNDRHSILRKAKLVMWRFKRADMAAYVRDWLYNQGPAGWMIEYYYAFPTMISTYVFCPDGDCNLTENSDEYNGIWRMDTDTIRIVFYQKIVYEGVGAAAPWPEEHGHDQVPEYEQYQDKTHGTLFKRNLSWTAIINSSFSENERPYKFISRDASCP